MQRKVFDIVTPERIKIQNSFLIKMKKIAILSNINLDPLKGFLQRDTYEYFFAGYNQWLPELLNPSSELHTFCPDFVFIYLNAEELKSDISELFSSIDAFSEKHASVRFIVSNLAYPPYSVDTYINSNVSNNEINDQLYRYVSTKNHADVFDFNRLISLHGYKTIFDEKYWYLGRIKFSNQGFRIIAGEIANVLNCLQGKTKKVLVLDFDNTLWGGVVGEDGWSNLQLSEEGVGLVYADFQRAIKRLSQYGVILASCSKNNEADAREVFEKNTNTILKWEDFILHKVNWEQKTENMLQIASSLNVGLDSLVFIDDNPVERELVKQTLPEVTVVDFPKDTSELNRWFINEVVYPYFAKRNVTREDLDKSNQYKRNIVREDARSRLSYDDFIRQLNYKLSVIPVDNNLYQRAAQLSQKTNQFNVTGNRYTDLDIRTMSESGNYNMYVCEYEDKFGKEGIIGAVILRPTDGKAVIDLYVLSCRVLGRKVEFHLLEQLTERLKKAEIKTLETTYVETSRNGMAKTFLLEAGFTTTNDVLFTKEI